MSSQGDMVSSKRDPQSVCIAVLHEPIHLWKGTRFADLPWTGMRRHGRMAVCRERLAPDFLADPEMPQLEAGQLLGAINIAPIENSPGVQTPSKSGKAGILKETRR